MKLEKLIDRLCQDVAFQLKKPSIVLSSGESLFMQGPPALRQAMLPNLQKSLSELMEDGQSLSITDPVFVGDVALMLKINFAKE